ncbi:Rhombotin-1 [Nymphon striatum]|nr:Rhombotin-1 [Nymphon striatum]
MEVGQIVTSQSRTTTLDLITSKGNTSQSPTNASRVIDSMVMSGISSSGGQIRNSTSDNCQQIISCAGCQEVIRERYMLKAMNQHWHEDCLKCSCCECRLGEVGSSLFTKANLILCKRDYLSIHARQANRVMTIKQQSHDERRKEANISKITLRVPRIIKPRMLQKVMLLNLLDGSLDKIKRSSFFRKSLDLIAIIQEEPSGNIALDLENISQIIDTTMNPFVESLLPGTNLYCVTDGKKASDKATAKKKVSNFASSAIKSKIRGKDEKVVELKTTRDLMGRLVYLACTRNIELEKVFLLGQHFWHSEEDAKVQTLQVT